MMTPAITIASDGHSQPDRAWPPSFAGNAGSGEEFNEIGITMGFFYYSCNGPGSGRLKAQAGYMAHVGPFAYWLQVGRWHTPAAGKSSEARGGGRSFWKILDWRW